MTAQPSQTMGAAATGAGMTIALCFAVAVLEGFDIQAMGVAAPKLGAELQLAKPVLGQALAASNIGLVIGAALGGWLADKIGRKLVLIFAVLTFGAFTLGTMASHSYDFLFAMRFGAGLGFGAALPNLMALAAEVAPKETRGSTGTMMFCGMPVGGGTVALISWLTPAQDWRTLFLIGGLTPLILAPALFFLMRETRAARPVADTDDRTRVPIWWWPLMIVLFVIFNLGFQELTGEAGKGLGVLLTTTASGLSFAGTTAENLLHVTAPWLALLACIIGTYMVVHRRALLGQGRAVPSVLLWIVFFPTLLILYLILNWLPTLVVAKGFPKDASQASVWFNFSSVAGALILGRLVDRFGVRWPITLAYVGLIGSLFALAGATTLPMIMALSGAVGFFLLGANYALYGAAASYYPAPIRGRGSGAAVAWGRYGAVAGPLVGGFLMGAGKPPGDVVSAMIPFAVVAAIGLLVLSFTAKPTE